MEFWNSILTEKSWESLQDLQKKPFQFIVIGGWAAYLWTKQHKSKDLDIILPEFKDLDYLKKEYALKKNDTLKKYEIVFGEIDVDIYVPHYSKLGLPITEIVKHTTKIEGIQVVLPEILLILKQSAELDRRNSIKGRKDRVDIITLLLFTEINFSKYQGLLVQYHLEPYSSELKKIILEFRDFDYVGLNPRQYKPKKKELLGKLR